MSYRVGFCPMCDAQIMVQDSNGRWNSYKPNFRQVDVKFDDGHRLRTIICADCFEKEPDFEKLIDSITHDDSEACNDGRKTKIKERGTPVSWALAKTKQGIALKR